MKGRHRARWRDIFVTILVTAAGKQSPSLYVLACSPYEAGCYKLLLACGMLCMGEGKSGERNQTLVGDPSKPLRKHFYHGTTSSQTNSQPLPCSDL